MSSLLPCRLQSGMNLQICFVNDSGSDKDSDADDSKTETSLDTPLSPMVRPRGQRNESPNSRETRGGARSCVQARPSESESEKKRKQKELTANFSLTSREKLWNKNSHECTLGKIIIRLCRENMRYEII